MPMEGLKRRLSFRKKKKDKVPECSKPHQWQEDEKKVRDGTCSFQVRYLGCVEVFESRGMQVCEEAVKTLKAQCKGKYQRAILYVSGDALRVVDEISKSMIVDQTIEKVSFCAPDRNHEKGFAYICRDGTTRRWMCHGFLAVKESGERLSHAVGCAFAICLERKQKRDKDSGGTVTGVTVTYSQDRTTFERTGSFRQTTITERLNDPQSAILAEPVPVRKVDNPFAVQRPHATQNMLVRQGSFRGFSKLQEASSPFKRTLSLRVNELPSTLQRQNAVELSPTKVSGGGGGLNNNGVIQEVPSPEHEDSISQMCQQLTQGLTALTDDPFAHRGNQAHHPTGPVKQHSMPATFQTTQAMINHPAPAIHETNPWAMSGHSPSMGSAPKPDIYHHQGRSSPATNPFLSSTAMSMSSPTSNGITASATPPHLQHHTRSHSVDPGDMGVRHQDKNKHTLLEMAHHQSFQINGGSANQNSATGWPASRTNQDLGDWSKLTNQSSGGSSSGGVVPHKSDSATGGGGTDIKDDFDPFDVAWAAKPANKQDQGQGTGGQGVSNPFSNSTKTVTTYKVEL